MSGTLPKWLEQVLGIDAAAGEATRWTLVHAWPLAPSITLLLGVAAMAFVVTCYLREAGTAPRRLRVTLAALRLTALGIVAALLGQFHVILSLSGLPYVVVVVDDSSSMGIADRYADDQLKAALARYLGSAGMEKATRLDLAKAVLVGEKSPLLLDLDQRYKLKLYFVSDTARVQSGDLKDLVARLGQAEPVGESTRLGQGIRAVLNDLRGTPPTAIVLFSDGITTDGEALSDAAAYARRKGVPLFAVALGSETPVKDIELADLLVDEVAFVDDVVNFECKLTSTGYAGKRVEVLLREQGQTEVLAKIDVTLGADGKPQKVRLPYRPTKVGDFEYVLEVPHQADEVHTDNNRQQRLVSVRKEQVRTLLVQSYPSYEFRYLKHMLERDSTIDVKVVLQEADLQYSEIDKSALRVFPVRREELFEYDVLVFGDVDPAFLSAGAMSDLSAFVTQKGGGLVFLAGPAFTPLAFRDTSLASLVPIDFNGAAEPPPDESLGEGFRAEPTELGLSMPTLQLGDSVEETLDIWRKLPPLYWLFEAPHLKPAARILAEGRTRDGRRLPLVALQYVGSGKVLFHATDETWRWRYRVGDVYFARYWVQTIRYLARSKLLGKDRSAELTVDRREYRRGEPVRLRVRFVDERLAPVDDDGVTVMLESEGHPNRRVQLRRSTTNRGIFEGLFTKAADGKYHAWIAVPALEGGAPPADFRVVAPPGEFERVQLDAAEMRQAAENSQGRYYTLATVHDLLSQLPSGRHVTLELLPPLSELRPGLWYAFMSLVIAVFVALLVVEWIVRKRVGML